jgi:hypothetical protein
MKTKELYDRACVQIDAQAEHIGELMKENATLKEVGKERDEFYLKYIAEAEENAKLRKSREKLAETMIYQIKFPAHMFCKFVKDEDGVHRPNGTDDKEEAIQSWIEWSEE